MHSNKKDSEKKCAKRAQQSTQLSRRAVWEEASGFTSELSGVSIGAFSDKITEIHQTYNEYQQLWREAVSTAELRNLINPDYISGVIEGDGCITLGCLQVRQTSYPRFTAALKLVVEEGGVLLLQIFNILEMKSPISHERKNKLAFIIIPVEEKY